MLRFFYATVFLLTLSLASHAETPLEEVVVTGELRTSSLLKLSNSVSVIDAEAIQSRHADNIEDLFNLVPNINFAQGASRGRFIQIRGIGERSQFVAPINPSVGIHVDGIDFTGIGTGVTLLDAQQVEIFRGPQGTLFGANALAGMVNVTGNRPRDEYSGSVSLGLGNFHYRDATLKLNVPLDNTSGWRAAIKKTEDHGYIKNDYRNKEDTNNIDELSIRNHLTIVNNEDLALDLITYFIDIDNGYDAFSLDNNRHTLSDQPGHDRQNTLANALNITIKNLTFADLSSTISHANSDVEYGYDEDWSFLNICAIDSDCAFFQYSSTDNYERDNNNKTVDIRLSSKESTDPFAWVIGAYHREQDVHLERTQVNNLPNENPYVSSTPSLSLYDSTYHTENIALYGELDITLSEKIKLISGLRFENFSAKFNDSDTANFKPNDDFWGGKIAVEYHITPQQMAYALVSRGYKAGGFNPDTTLEEDLKTFEAETMTNLEFGVKGRWLDNSLTAQVAVFYQERSDIQAKQSRGYDNTDGTKTFVEFFDNAAGGSNYGVESEIQWYPRMDLRLFASLGLLETQYSDFINVSHVDRDDNTGEGYDMSQRDQAHAPNYQYFTGAEYDIIPTLSLRVELEGKDAFYFSESHNEKSQAFNLINVRLNYTIKKLDLSVWAKNLTNEEVETRGFYFSNDFGNDPRKEYAPEPYTQKGAPRTYGINAKLSF